MRQIASIAAIVNQHASDAAFLWFRRSLEIDGPILGEEDIGRIDQRLDANIEGLLASGQAAWEAARAQLADFAEPGELFVVSALALRSGEKPALDAALGAAATIGEAGFSGAIARTPRESLRPLVAQWLDSREPLLQRLGLCALWHHRVDPGARLGDLLLNSNQGVRLRALRLAGALKRRDLLAGVFRSLEAESPEERFCAAMSACLMGEARQVHPAIDKLVLAQPDLAAAAIELRLLTTTPTAGKAWLQSRLDQTALRAPAIAAIGLFDDRTVMPWLIERMREPDMAFSAGLALRDLFEVDFNDHTLFSDDPATLGPAFAKAESGPLPIADKVAAWWDEGRGGKGHYLFRSMRRLRLEAFRTAFAQPDARLADWRHTRRFPAWM